MSDIVYMEYRFTVEPKNPASDLLIAELGEVGFESFNFKLLSKRIDSTEASVYRYFENKNLLLIYLVSWYWELVSYMIDINTLNIKDPEKKLKIILGILVHTSRNKKGSEYIN